jgi:stage II sporulation protein GA (sporulation sigma-E factor processing peptidase)
MTLYVDIIFLENLIMNSIIILATGIILKNTQRIWRNLVSSGIGAIYAILIYTSNFKIYSNIILKVILSVVIVYIAFKPANIRSFLKHIIIFYLTSFTFGGVAFALLYFVRPQDILFQNGVLIGTYPIKMILAGGILGFIIITCAFKNIKGKLTRKDMMCTVIIGNTRITAIVDTGNLLKDPITKMPVLIMEREMLKGIFPEIILENATDIVNGKEIELGEYSSKLRVIPYKSIGKENGLLLGIKAKNIRIVYQDIEKAHDVIIGIYTGTLSKNNKYSAIVGLELL